MSTCILRLLLQTRTLAMHLIQQSLNLMLRKQHPRQTVIQSVRHPNHRSHSNRLRRRSRLSFALALLPRVILTLHRPLNLRSISLHLHLRNHTSLLPRYLQQSLSYHLS